MFDPMGTGWVQLEALGHDTVHKGSSMRVRATRFDGPETRRECPALNRVLAEWLSCCTGDHTEMRAEPVGRPPLTES